MSDQKTPGEQLEQAFHQGPNLEEIKPGLPNVGGLPVSWHQGSNPNPVTVSEAQVNAFKQQADGFTCGNCKFFDLKTGQKEMVKQRFADRLVRDEKWKLHHLGTPLAWTGLCGASNGELATSVVSKACDQFRPRTRSRFEKP